MNMQTIIVAMALGIAALCGFMFYTRYGRFLITDEVSTFPSRVGWMWGSLTVIALILAVVASRKA